MSSSESSSEDGDVDHFREVFQDAIGGLQSSFAHQNVDQIVEQSYHRVFVKPEPEPGESDEGGEQPALSDEADTPAEERNDSTSEEPPEEVPGGEPRGEPIGEEPADAPPEEPEVPLFEGPAEAPAEETEEVPAEAPAEVSPEMPTDEAPAAAEEPAETPVDDPDETPPEEPADAPPEEPEEPPPEVPEEPPPEAPEEPPPEVPEEPPPEVPEEPPPEVPEEPPPEAPEESPPEAPEEPPPEAPEEPLPEVPEGPPPEASEEPSSEVVDEPSPEEPTDAPSMESEEPTAEEPVGESPDENAEDAQPEELEDATGESEQADQDETGAEVVGTRESFMRNSAQAIQEVVNRGRTSFVNASNAIIENLPRAEEALTTGSLMLACLSPMTDVDTEELSRQLQTDSASAYAGLLSLLIVMLMTGRSRAMGCAVSMWLSGLAVIHVMMRAALTDTAVGATLAYCSPPIIVASILSWATGVRGAQAAPLASLAAAWSSLAASRVFVRLSGENVKSKPLILVCGVVFCTLAALSVL